MATTNTVKRITKAQRFADIKALLNGEDVTHGTTVEDAVKFIDAELALLAKKNSGDKKPTEKQKENEVYKAKILDFLRTQEDGVTCTEIQKAIPEFADFNNQKVAALMRQLYDEGRGPAGKKMVKGKALFFIA